MDFKALLNTPEYDFLRTNPRLGDRIMLLGVSGSYGYGTNREGSDIDFRGVTLNQPSDLIGLTAFEQYEDEGTDTVIYSFNKLVGLLLSCNPNTIEILGLDDDQYLIRSSFGQELLDHRSIFLSKRAITSFGRFADAQFKRMQNAIARNSLPELSGREQAEKSGKRIQRKDDNHLNKHAMHLVRLYMMGIDILEKAEIRTHRPENDLQLLRGIRSGDFRDGNDFSPEFYEVVEEYRRRFQEAERNCVLPDHPDMEAAERFVESINRRVVMGETG